MIDLVKLHLQAGDGGNGRVAFRREKYIPKGGPSGGNGGEGGQVIIRGAKNKRSLVHLSGTKTYQADNGQSGGKQKRMGAKGESIVIEVPVGTRVWLLAENEISHQRRQRYSLEYLFNRNDIEFKKYFLEAEGQAVPRLKDDAAQPISAQESVTKQLLQVIKDPSDSLKDIDFKQLPKQQLVEITSQDQEIVICQGGFGGRGNNTFKGPANTTPLEAEHGTFGERKIVVLEQLLLADVGLVGFPNAGKSTLISVLTQARPKVGNYPFTTLEPHLGIMSIKDKELVVADIPGLIEGASQGKGLGHAFLRHVEHCRLLLFVLFLPEEIVFDQEMSVGDKAKQVYEQFAKLQRELDEYGQDLKNKPYLVGVNKQDIYSQELITAIEKLFAKKDQELLLFSAATKEGIVDLVGILNRVLS
jgi:GTPase